MPTISVFDMFRIGVGPSSSHTLGPWRIVRRFLTELEHADLTERVEAIRFELLGSLALTGRGHATDKAICLALLGQDPETIPVESIPDMLAALGAEKRIALRSRFTPFDPGADIRFLKTERHPGHANVMRCIVELDGGERLTRTYASLGGGFIASEEELEAQPAERIVPTHPVRSGADLLEHCARLGMSVSDVVRENERCWFTDGMITDQALRIWRAMRMSIVRGCSTPGVLPGGLGVTRRAPGLIRELVPIFGEDAETTLTQAIRASTLSFEKMLRVVSCFAIAVNEENAALGRVVTAPTNGAAGVIPAVMMYRNCFAREPLSEEESLRFLLVAGQIGALFKQNATISAAMGGCQAEIGVSSAMAAAGLAERMGGSAGQTLMAAEIAMEHHLGMTCDPVGGLVQVPCIERNAMGALKAISAAVLACESDPAHARVSLDEVIGAMWDTAREMNDRYKETSLGGLAVKLSVRVTEC